MIAEPSSPPSLKDIEARLAKLREEARLEPDGGKEEAGGRPPPNASALGMAMRVGVELVAGLAVGGGIGWLLDGWLGTSPFLLLLFFLLGAAAGMLNVYRMALRLNAPDGPVGRGGKNDDKRPA